MDRSALLGSCIRGPAGTERLLELSTGWPCWKRHLSIVSPAPPVAVEEGMVSHEGAVGPPAIGGLLSLLLFDGASVVSLDQGE